MKNYPSLAIIILFLSVPQLLTAQKDKDSTKLKIISDLVDNQHYNFIAESVTPLTGRLRQLDTQYDVEVSKEKVVADLPYFGTAYFAPTNPAEGGIKFTSKKYDYAVTRRKKDGWEILIRGRDITDPPNLNLTVYSNGKATLQVTSNNRQGISFNGYITAPDKVK